MILRQLKQYLEGLSESELDKELGYNSEYTSGVVIGIRKSETDLYFTGDDDPSRLYTKEQLKENGCEEEEINRMVIEIHKGDHLIDI